ncbi:MAG: hypothetical protein NTW32_01555 [Chloroflexi bacterium]|nr:hypothetical protein [Chloroflexota bacterium]
MSNSGGRDSAGWCWAVFLPDDEAVLEAVAAGLAAGKEGFPAGLLAGFADRSSFLGAAGLLLPRAGLDLVKV